MPELPEVETICRQLHQVVLGARILETQIIDPKLGGITGLEERDVLAIQRYGKALKMEIEGGLKLLIHFRMTGRLLWEEGDSIPSHVRLVLSFPQGRVLLIDPRRFGTFSVQGNGGLPLLGGDPLEDFKSSQMWEVSRKSSLLIKSFLMDQRRIAGIGNIYACEILHQAHISPWRRVCDLSLVEWENAVMITRSILSRAIACRGTTISDWRDLFGREGEYQNHLMVYGRGGERCFECGEEILRRNLNGRGTYFCPSCQN